MHFFHIEVHAAPMKKYIYLIRHGQTDYNLNGIVQGKGINSELNETGRWQAERFYLQYRQVGFDSIYVSTLKRTFQTVFPFLQDGIKIQKRTELDEISWGDLEGKKHSQSVDFEYAHILKCWEKGLLTEKIPGGESALELQKKQLPIIEELRKADFKNILLCSHGRAMRALVCGFLGKPLSYMSTFNHTNTGLYLLSCENGTFRLELENNVAHLMSEAIPNAVV